MPEKSMRSSRSLCLTAAAVVMVVVVVHLVAAGGVSATYFEPFNVSYDHRALVIDGERRMLISAGIHYPRATPEVLHSSLYPA